VRQVSGASHVQSRVELLRAPVPLHTIVINQRYRARPDPVVAADECCSVLWIAYFVELASMAGSIGRPRLQ
jgi:hypothetical protein